MEFNTRTIHGRQHPEETSGAVMPPIFQTSTYVQQAPGQHKGHEYGRVSNPTRTALEELLADLENADECACFASGCAAMDAVMKMLRPGDHVVASNDLYGGSYRLFTEVFQPLGIEFTFVNMASVNETEAAISQATKMLWIETPTNPLLSIVDIPAMVDLSRSNNLISVVDNTFASPCLQKPLDMGIDAVIHSATKYIGGHSDLIHGAVCSSNKAVMENVRFQVKTTGAVPGPMDCYLALRGVKTLALRMERSCANARAIADHLNEHPKVGKVLYPGFTDHPGHETAKAQMSDFGAMVSFALKDDSVEKANRLMSETRFFSLAESLGGVESLISHPASMTHASIPREKRIEAGLSDSLIRLSVGIEDRRDLIADLDKALDQV